MLLVQYENDQKTLQMQPVSHLLSQGVAEDCNVIETTNCA